MWQRNYAVHAVIRNAAVTIKDPNFDLIDFLNTYPAQVSEEREGKREGEREKERESIGYYIFLFINYLLFYCRLVFLVFNGRL